MKEEHPDDASAPTAPTTGCDCPPPTGVAPAAPLGAGADVVLAVLCKALAHPARVQILRLLAARRSCICGELVEEFNLAQSTVSQHLKILKEAGLVRGQIQGPRTCYCLEPGQLAQLGALVSELVTAGGGARPQTTPNEESTP